MKKGIKKKESEKEKKVAIIISSYNQKDLVIKNIESLKKKLKIQNKIYFIDDSGTGNIAKEVKAKFSQVRIIINEKNEGFSKSYNQGIKLAKKEYNPKWFLILNDDCEIQEEGFLKKIISKTEQYPTTGIFGVKLIYSDGSIQWAKKKGKTYFYENKGKIEVNNEFSKDLESKEIIGAFMLIKKEFLESVGLFDEKFSPFYGEESDLCFRGLKKGWKIMYLGEFKIIHHRNKSISKISPETVWFIKKRNSFRLERKHYSFIKRFYYTLIHFGSIFKRDKLSITTKLNLLIKAYFKSRK